MNKLIIRYNNWRTENSKPSPRKKCETVNVSKSLYRLQHYDVMTTMLYLNFFFFLRKTERRKSMSRTKRLVISVLNQL